MRLLLACLLACLLTVAPARAAGGYDHRMADVASLFTQAGLPSPAGGHYRRVKTADGVLSGWVFPNQTVLGWNGWLAPVLADAGPADLARDVLAIRGPCRPLPPLDENEGCATAAGFALLLAAGEPALARHLFGLAFSPLVRFEPRREEDEFRDGAQRMLTRWLASGARMIFLAHARGDDPRVVALVHAWQTQLRRPPTQPLSPWNKNLRLLQDLAQDAERRLQRSPRPRPNLALLTRTQQIAEWIEALEDARYHQRPGPADQLIAAGPAALPALEAALYFDQRFTRIVQHEPLRVRDLILQIIERIRRDAHLPPSQLAP